MYSASELDINLIKHSEVPVSVYLLTFVKVKFVSEMVYKYKVDYYNNFKNPMAYSGVI